MMTIIMMMIITAGPGHVDVRGHHDRKVGGLGGHWVGVDLTHVVSRVRPPGVPDLQPPDVAVWLRDPDPVILRDDVLANGNISYQIKALLILPVGSILQLQMPWCY